jgi:hypothetical protein
MAGTDNAQDEGLLRVIGTGAVALAVVNMVVGGLLIQIPMVEAQTIGALIGVCIVIYVIKSALRKRESK